MVHGIRSALGAGHGAGRGRLPRRGVAAAATSFKVRVGQRGGSRGGPTSVDDEDLEEITLDSIVDFDEDRGQRREDRRPRREPTAQEESGLPKTQRWLIDPDFEGLMGPEDRPVEEAMPKEDLRRLLKEGSKKRSTMREPYKGYFDRRDLPQLDVKDLDQDGEFEGMTLEEIEDRVSRSLGTRTPKRPQRIWPADIPRQPPRDAEPARGAPVGPYASGPAAATAAAARSAAGPRPGAATGQRFPGGEERQPRPSSTWGRYPPEPRAGGSTGRRLGAERLEDLDPLEVQQLGRRGAQEQLLGGRGSQEQLLGGRGGRVIDPLLGAGVKSSQPAPPPNPKGRATHLSSWLMPAVIPKPRTPKEEIQKEEEFDDRANPSRVGNSKFTKMYKAVLRRLGSLPWHHVEGQLSWTDLSEKSWKDIGIDTPQGEKLARTLEGFGVAGPNVLQVTAAPILLRGVDAILTSMTGSGKTLAFLIPLLRAHVLPALNVSTELPQARLVKTWRPAPKQAESRPRLLIVAPSRELAAQTFRIVRDLLEPFPRLNCTLLLGGTNHMRQDESLKSRKPVVVVGTPGRIMDHASEGRLVLTELRAVVLDEIDSLLNVSRKDHMELLMEKITPLVQRVLVSATGAASQLTADFAMEHLREPYETIGPKNNLELPPRVLHLVNPAPDVNKKLLFLKRLSNSNPLPNGVLVFCNNFERARKVAEQLRYMNIPAEVLSGNRSKESRERAVRNMDTGKIDMLVATDIATRGLDFRGMTHVVNFELPGDSTAYAHRAGRCGRHGHNGIVISLAGGGTQNMRMSRYAAELNITLFEANVQDGELGTVEALPSPRTGGRPGRF